MQFEVMSFGLTATPLTFVRLLGDLADVMVYLDDIIIFSKDITSHFKTLQEVLQRLQKAGLKIKVRKCQFLFKSLEYLRHVVTPEGIKMQECKIKCICDYPAPKSVKEVGRFLGMAGYYLPFIQNFS